MRRQTTITFLSLLVLASACNKSNYAQVEPDDLYFSHKDRKEAIGDYTMASASAATETAIAYTESASAYEPSSDYSSQHAPVLTSPSYGSPTIQQYGQRPYYDETVNPDYIYEQEYVGGDDVSSEYYVEDYQYTIPQDNTEPQIVNNYYGVSPYSVSANAYSYNMMYPYGYSSSPYRNRWAMMFYGNGFSYGHGYSPYSSYYMSYYDPFHYSPWYSNDYYWNTMTYGSYYSCYAPSNSNNTNSYYDSGNTYVDGTKYLVKPRSSRSTVSYYANKDNVSIKQRREDYIPSTTGEGGRVAGRTTVQSTRTSSPEQVGYTRRSSSVTYQPTTTRTVKVAADRKPASVTVQQYRTRAQNDANKTVVRPTQNRTSTARNGNSSQQRRTKINTSQPNIGNASYSKQSTRNGYNSNSATRSRNSYSPANYGSRSRSNSSGYNSRSSSTYQPRSTSSPSRSRSSYTPSRSSTPTRTSAPSRSTPTRSSSSSSSSSRTKRN